MALRTMTGFNDKEYDEEAASLIDTSIPEDIVDNPVPTKPSVDTAMIKDFALSFCGLLISYVTWGIMQELIMSTKFNESPLVPSGMFPSCKLKLISIHIYLYIFI